MVRKRRFTNPSCFAALSLDSNISLLELEANDLYPGVLSYERFAFFITKPLRLKKFNFLMSKVDKLKATFYFNSKIIKIAINL